MAANWTGNQKSYGEYVVASVETNLDYGGTYLVDAITIGITQWWAYHACRLLEKLRDELPDNYAKVSQRIRDAVAAHPHTDEGFWEEFYMTNDDSDSWKTAAQDKDNHTKQDELWDADAYGNGGYTDKLSRWGVNVDNVKSCIFYLSIYHQSPKSCLEIIRNIGGDRSIEDIRSAALNHYVVGKYKNRQNTVYDLLNKWDGTSAPPDFGQGTPGSTPQNPDTGSGQVQSSVAYVQKVNDNLIIYGAQGTGNQLLCYYNGNGLWYPVRNASAPNYPSTGGGSGGGGTPPSGEFASMQRLWTDNEKKWDYSQAAGRLNPPQSGYSDCSACIWWAANAATNNKYSWLGTSTYTMLTTATSIFKNSSGSLDVSKMQPGDLIIVEWKSGVQHVDWYWGNNEVWGAGSSPLPHRVTQSGAATYLEGRVNWVNVMRFLRE